MILYGFYFKFSYFIRISSLSNIIIIQSYYRQSLQGNYPIYYFKNQDFQVLFFKTFLSFLYKGYFLEKAGHQVKSKVQNLSSVAQENVKEFFLKAYKKNHNDTIIIISMSLDFYEILVADIVDQFGYINQLQRSYDNFSSGEKQSTSIDHLEERPMLRKIDPFSDPQFIEKQAYCKNSAFKKKIVALNAQINEENYNQKSHQIIPKKHLDELELEPQSNIFIEYSQQSSKSKTELSIKRKKTHQNSKVIKSNDPIKLGKKCKKIQSKKIQPKKDPYPTKNILPCFRSFFINEILSKSPQCSNLQIIQRIQGKPCINLRDCQDLFNHPITRPILADYFQRNQLYRDLLQSRVQLKLKLIYHSKIPVFQEAFRLGVFKGIN